MENTITVCDICSGLDHGFYIFKQDGGGAIFFYNSKTAVGWYRSLPIITSESLTSNVPF